MYTIPKTRQQTRPSTEEIHILTTTQQVGCTQEAVNASQEKQQTQEIGYPTASKEAFARP